MKTHRPPTKAALQNIVDRFNRDFPPGTKVILRKDSGEVETRPLTRQECFLHGQLLAQFKGAVIAEVLTGKAGRFLVVSEDDINSQLQRARKVN